MWLNDVIEHILPVCLIVQNKNKFVFTCFLWFKYLKMDELEIKVILVTNDSTLDCID